MHDATRTVERWGRCFAAVVTMAVGATVAVIVGAPAFAHAQAALHAPYDKLLRAHVRDGLVDYEAFARAPEFPRYLAALDTVTVATLSEDERLAYWINVYNAYTIQLVLRHNERQSIRNINRTLGFLQLKGPWNERIVRAGGQVYSLDQVLHRILRREFHEPRVHLALVPAAKGAPPLRSEAYVGERLSEQLEDQTRRVLSDTAHTWYRNGVLGVNALFLAYERDFGTTRKELVQFIAPYVTLRPTEPQRARLLEGRPIVQGRSYDWSLNVARP